MVDLEGNKIESKWEAFLFWYEQLGEKYGPRSLSDWCLVFITLLLLSHSL